FAGIGVVRNGDNFHSPLVLTRQPLPQFLFMVQVDVAHGAFGDLLDVSEENVAMEISALPGATPFEGGDSGEFGGLVRVFRCSQNLFPSADSGRFTLIERWVLRGGGAIA